MANISIKLAAESERKQRPDDGDLAFGKYFTDHMFVMDYDGSSWHSARIVPHEPFLIDPSAMVFHYGQSVFEGMKAHRAPDGRIMLFRPELNFARMNKSNVRMCIPPIEEDTVLAGLKELIKADKDWVPASKGTSLYIRPFVIATEAALGVHPSRSYKFIIILCPVGPYYKAGFNPVKIMVEDEYVRAVRGGAGFAKASANYAISLKGQEKAIEKGCSQVLWLDAIERKYIEEVGTMNVFFIIDGVVVTPMLTESILPGVTRDSVIQLLKHWGVPVEERRIAIDEVFEAGKKGTLQEAFGTGTAVVISPVGALMMGDERITINNGETGPTAQKLFDTLTGIQCGSLPDEWNWTVTV